MQLITFIEALRTISLFLLIFSSGFYLHHLEKTKKQRKLTKPEFVLYIITLTGFMCSALSLFLYVFG
jgi:uncharacterized membrane protein YbjE (DUF340 family)